MTSPTTKRAVPSTSPSVIAEAAVLADLSVLLLLTGVFIPAFAVAAPLVATVPMAVLYSRRGGRAVGLAATIGLVVALLVGGLTTVSMVTAALYGIASAIAIRRNWGQIRAVLVGLVVCWLPLSAATVASFAVLTESRELTLDATRNQARGIVNGLERLLPTAVGFDSTVPRLFDFIDWCVEYWYIGIPIGQLILTVLYSVTSFILAKPIIERIDDAFGTSVTSHSWPSPVDDTTPLPLDARDVVVRVASRTRPLVQLRSLTLTSGEQVALVGSNGAGKSTLLRVLSGLSEFEGSVQHGTAANLGAVGGTHFIAQRPASGFLGARVRDELQWGHELPLDVSAMTEALERVGVNVPLDQSVEQLSGGEAARVALARVILATPSLVLVDELAAMLDPASRIDIAEQLASLTERGAAVLYATHNLDEVRRASRIVELPESLHP